MDREEIKEVRDPRVRSIFDAVKRTGGDLTTRSVEILEEYIIKLEETSKEEK